MEGEPQQPLSSPASQTPPPPKSGPFLGSWAGQMLAGTWGSSPAPIGLRVSLGDAGHLPISQMGMLRLQHVGLSEGGWYRQSGSSDWRIR